MNCNIGKLMTMEHNINRSKITIYFIISIYYYLCVKRERERESKAFDMEFQY